MRSYRRPMILLPALMAVGSCALNPIEIEPFREVSCFEAAKISLHDAVKAAEIEGGLAMDAAYRQTEEMGCLEGNAGYYDVTVLVNGRIVPVSVDAKSQQIQPHLDQGFARDVMGQYIERLAEGGTAQRIPVARQEKLPLSEAIAIAERSGGKAMEARVQAQAGKPGYAVKLVDHGKLRMDWIDGAKTP
jgi:hypothetical protein